MIIDTTNKYLVGIRGGNVVVLLPPRPGEGISKENALNLAAYLVSMAGASEEEFREVLQAVENT